MSDLHPDSSMSKAALPVYLDYAAATPVDHIEQITQMVAKMRAMSPLWDMV